MTGILNILSAVKTGIAAAVDEFFNRTTLLLTGNGTNGAQNNTFLDSSTNNFTITRNGNTTQGTFSPFSQTGWGEYFDGTSDYVSAGSNAAFAFGTGAYTVEFWIYPFSATSSQFICSNDASGGFNVWLDTGTLNVGSWGSGGFMTASSAFTANAWNHVVVCRASTTSSQAAIFVNGTRKTLGTDSSNWTVNGPFVYGGSSQISSSVNGYISNIRVVKGTDVYGYSNSTITVPTAALTAITNTSLLAAQSNRFKDNSTNNFSLTITGTPSVQAFSPFAPTAAYSAATNGASGYFDGTGDYLSLTGGVTDNGTGDLTFEAWVYYTGTYADYTTVFDSRTSPYTNGFAVSANITNGNWGLNFAVTDIATSVPAAKNAWTHVAVTRSGNTFRMFINGVLQGTVTSTNNLTSTTNRIGSNYNNAQVWIGYIGDLRVIKGSIPTAYQTSSTTVGTSIFTPPTAPLTAVSGTSLLTSFTNAGITDATAKNDLETVGNAQISTTQSKFGGSSMYFDGTGDYLVGPSNAFYNFGTGDFTIECWIRFSTVNAAKMIVSSNYNSGTGGGGWAFIYRGDISSLSMSVNSNVTYTKSWSPSANTWYHVAVCRSGTNMRLFVDGTQLGTTSTSSDNVSGASTIVVGGNLGGGTNLTLDGYIDDLRITNYARYTSNFTPPTAAFALQ